MSDWRRAAQAELLSLVTGIEGVAEVTGSLSMNDLVKRDAGGSLPAIGAAYAGHERFEDDELGADHRYVIADFDVFIVARNGDTRAAALDEVVAILGRLDEKLDGARSAIPPLWSWEATTEEVTEYENDAVSALVRVSNVFRKDTA